ncbi:hypothetical protein CC1G_05168 [Coprinopsis cinerea okayama7|uniref:UFSP1/2/DUB catalytic domain-containing protein n=1 Tax=Coprinopsis cinerea (strain Okayama-7 / 130 / ATCC MYA-4618 / FGSC 9003) TaxID=240176 RepID=A8NG40_COPC7|nr:hypothetical protein CC1G_05168 [Coprinopsis cinerea okayama7\|eukprot:XP_001833468.2 hypothetical protein CC1G_05168 [Coprinopsis cinerea okayama7\
MTNSIRCEICHDDLKELTVQLRQLHYEQHFEEGELSGIAASPSPTSPSTSTSTSSKIAKPKRWLAKPRKFFKENDVFWYPSQEGRPPPNYTPGIDPPPLFLVQVFDTDAPRSHTASKETVFIQHEAWDMTWGCGYRNFLMACACLMVHPFQPMYFPLLDDPVPPSVRNLQGWIEDAWDKGFDTEGKAQLKHLVGTRKWIGTADLWVAFSSRGIPAELVDFTDASNVQMVIDWIVNYFSPPESAGQGSRNAFQALVSTNPVTVTDKPPIILQHAGHSRSIVGYEVNRQGEVNLLAFDSGTCLPKEIREMALSLHKSASDDNDKENNKRKMNLEVSSPNPKRQRSCKFEDDEVVIVGSTVQGDDDEIIYTGSNSPLKKAEGSKSGLSGPSKSNTPGGKTFDYKGIVRHFRLGSKKLGKNKQYQILYFPMTEPLSDSEIRSRKVVTSTKIC